MLEFELTPVSLDLPDGRPLSALQGFTGDGQQAVQVPQAVHCGVGWQQSGHLQQKQQTPGISNYYNITLTKHL